MFYLMKVAEVDQAAPLAAYLGEHQAKRLPGSMDSGLVGRDEEVMNKP